MIHLWNTATATDLARWPAHDAAVTAFAFTKDGEILFSGAADGTLKVWNLPYIRRELAKLGLDWK